MLWSIFLIVISTSSVSGLKEKYSSIVSTSFSNIIINTAQLANKSVVHPHRPKRDLPPQTYAGYQMGCGETWACTSEATWANSGCPFILKWSFIPSTEYMRFQLIGLRFNGPPGSCQPRSDGALLGYIGIGFSAHDSMGDNIAVIECSVTEGTGGTLVKNVTFGRDGKNSNEYYYWDKAFNCVGNPDSRKIKDCTVENINNGDMDCSFSLKRRIIYKQSLVNFEDSDYFVHIFSGCASSEITDGISHAGQLYVSADPIHFHNKRQGLYAILRSTWTVVHGSMMTLAWCIFIPNGVFFARYFKESYVEVSIFRYRPWFAVHTLSTIVAFILSIAATIAMMEGRSEIKFEWPKSPPTRFHYQFGFIALFLLAGLVFTGWMRFVGRKARRIFAFIHFLSGTLCYIFSMMTLGRSQYLGMPCRVTTYTVVLVMWSIVCHCAMMVHFYFLDKRLGLYFQRALYPVPLTPVTYDELPGSRIRLIIIGVHFLGTSLMTLLILMDYSLSEGCTCEGDICR